MFIRVLLVCSAVFFTGIPAVLAQEAPAAKPKTAIIGLYINSAPTSLNQEYLQQLSSQISATGHTEIISNRSINIVLEDRNLDARRNNPADILMAIDTELQSAEDLLYENPSKAVAVFRDISRRLSKLLRESGSNSEVWDRSFKSRMLWSRALLDNNKREDATYVLRETIRTFGTSREVSMQAGYHPTLVKAYNRSLESLQGERNGHLTVDSQPAGAIITLNGQVTQYTTPHEFKDLFPGAYHVKVSDQDRVSLVHFVEVDARRTARITADLDLENHILRKDNQIFLQFNSSSGIKKKIELYGSELGKWLGVDYVLIMGVVNTSTGEKLRSSMIHVVPGKRVAYESVSVPSNQFSMDAVQRTALAMTSPWHTGGSGTASGFKKGPVIGWSLIGAGAITLGISLHFASSYATNKANAHNINWPTECPTPNPPGLGCNPSDPAAEPYGDDERKKAADAANSATNMGIVTGILGAAMLGGGIWTLMNVDDNSQTAGPLKLDLPGGGQVVPVIGAEHTGFNLGYTF